MEWWQIIILDIELELWMDINLKNHFQGMHTKQMICTHLTVFLPLLRWQKLLHRKRRRRWTHWWWCTGITKSAGRRTSEKPISGIKSWQFYLFTHNMLPRQTDWWSFSGRDDDHHYHESQAESQGKAGTRVVVEEELFPSWNVLENLRCHYSWKKLRVVKIGARVFIYFYYSPWRSDLVLDI